MIYTTGTIAISGSTLTGTGTNFTASGSLIRVGCTVIAMSNPVQVFQITAVGSATSLSVTPAASPALAAGTKFAILLSDSLSVDGLAQDIAETFTLYQKNISGFADVMNGSADVTITINGVAVTVPGQQSLAKKGANKDITSLSGLTTALSIEQGGTGGKDAITARTKLEVVYQRSASLGLNDNLNTLMSTSSGEYRCASNASATSANNYPTNSAGSLKVYTTLTGVGALSCVQEYRTYLTNRLFMRRYDATDSTWSAWVEFYNSGNLYPVASSPTSLGLADNLNDFDGTKTGEYYQSQSANATPGNNYPVQWAGGLKVYRSSGGDSGKACVQEYRTHNTNRLFMRNQTGGVWSAWVEFFGSGSAISTSYNIATTGSISSNSCVVENSNYPSVRWVLRYTDGTTIPADTIGKFNLLECSMAPGGTVSTVNLLRRNGNNDSTGQITISFPTTAGTLALQGTSGIDYKHDVTDADYSEAIARIDSLRMVNFVYNDDEQNRLRFGIIAEEAELTAPQYIKHNDEQYEDILDNEGEKIGAKYRDRPSVDVNPIVMDLLGYAKALRKEVDALKDEIVALKTGGVKEDDGL